MTALMVQGCTSWAGKSWLVTALCRSFARQGVRVAPFKAQNMSNNARVVADGEIGVAQWLQARAAGIEPDVRMNPVLTKPERDGSQVVLLGRPDDGLSQMPWPERSRHLWPPIRTALTSLIDEFDLVILEGAGSPAEINLAAHDLVNMRSAAQADAAVLLAADIDRGGAFAHLYGTWQLVGDAYRDRIRGFVLNRFRGDATLLPPGPEQLESLTGVPTVGVVPMVDHDLPDEDGAALHRTPQHGGLPTVAIVRYPFASNLDEFTQLEQIADVRWATRPVHLTGAELIVLPGSKHVTADLAWVREHGLANGLAQAAGKVPVLGICGGMQLLGRQLIDDSGREANTTGLGLLPVVTHYAATKHTGTATVQFGSHVPPAFERLAAKTVELYDIRHGTTTTEDPDADVLAGCGWATGTVLGVAGHGLFEDPVVLQSLFDATPQRTLDDTFELLADTVDAHLDMAYIHNLTRHS